MGIMMKNVKRSPKNVNFVTKKFKRNNSRMFVSDIDVYPSHIKEHLAKHWPTLAGKKFGL